MSFAEASEYLPCYVCISIAVKNKYKGKKTAAVGWMAIEEGAWAVCVYNRKIYLAECAF